MLLTFSLILAQAKKYPKLFWVSAIAPLTSVIVATFCVYITRADKEGVAIVSTLNFYHFDFVFSSPEKGFGKLTLRFILLCQVNRIERGINPSSAHEIYWTGDLFLKGFKIGVVAGLIALTVS